MDRESMGEHGGEAEAFDLGSEQQVREGVQNEIERLEAAIQIEPNHETLVKLTTQLKALKDGKKLITPESGSVH